MSFLWVVMAILVALAIRLDGKVGGAYFAYSEIVFGYPELLVTYTAKPLWQGLLRRSLYPAFGGLVLGFLGRGVSESAAMGTLALFLLIWPAFLHGLPAQYPQTRILSLYVGLLFMGFGLGMTGWYVADALGSPEPILEYLKGELIGLVSSPIIWAFGGMIVHLANKRNADR